MRACHITFIYVMKKEDYDEFIVLYGQMVTLTEYLGHIIVILDTVDMQNLG